ncbi:MAG: hypothetical protein ACFWTJ_10075 [Lachnoclostridium sp.]
MIIKVNPLDTVLFRTPAPFNAGEDYIANSIFPPYPHTYAGMIEKNGSVVNDEKTQKIRYKIGISGVMLDDVLLFKQPLDLARCDLTGKRKGQVYYKQIEKAPVSNYPLEYITKEAQEWEEISRYKDYYMPIQEIENYINGRAISNKCYPLSNLYNKEIHTGIEISKESKSIVSTKMYKKNMIRLYHKGDHPLENKVALFFEISGADLKDNGIVKLGGRNKTATLKKVDMDINIPFNPNSSQYFKLYFATPAIFKNGWIPKWVSLNSQGFYDGVFTKKGRRVKVKLLCACVGNYLPVGGFSAENKQRPREMNYAIPSGSVYYFQLLEGKMEDVIKLFHQKCISDYRTGLGFDYEIRDRYRYCDRGYGYALVGNLTDEQISYLKGRNQ